MPPLLHIFVLVCPEEHGLGIINLLSSLGGMWVSCHQLYYLGACLLLLLHGFFFAKKAHLVLWISKPAFSGNR